MRSTKTNQVSFSNDLDFLANYHKVAQDIGYKIKQELSILDKSKLGQKNGLMTIINYSDLTNSWDVKDLLQGACGKSDKLTVLADKINYMINQGRSKDILPMVKRIVEIGVKKQSHKPSKHSISVGNKKTEFLGHAHFRWNHGAHTLSKKEIDHLKKYFNL